MTGNGGWHYGCGSSSTTDASTTGWAPEALRLLERKYGVETYQWAKTSHRAWLSSYCPSGICSYHGGGPKLAGNALVGYGWTEDQVNSGAGQTQASINAAQSWFQSDSSHWGLYFIYATTKGLRSFVPEVKFLPDGTDWSKSFIDFFVSGYTTHRSDTSARQYSSGHWDWVGSWSWGDSVSTNERTGLIIQIVQTWLEVWAYARAFPEFISPGGVVTFDHSWSYTLDPSVNIFNYKWNVIDHVQPQYPICQDGANGCTDQNGDGDCDDAGERCDEDLNGNGLIDEDEIVWDFETIDPFEQFEYSFSPDIDWGEEELYNVRLRVTDTQGRHVDDVDSVKVVVSKQNNPPTVVSHPDGPTVTYSGYAESVITLDGRSSYDVDAIQVPFPGDDNRPAGIVDSITTIHFDLNQDGDFDDEGEDGTDQAVSFTVTPNAAIGDLISIPVRVCDDGQWTNECVDAFDNIDCSKCAVGSASIRLLLNSEPPDIDLCGPEASEDEDCGTISVGTGGGSGGGSGLEGIDIDLGGTKDPEGALGITYEYILVQGEGVITTDPAYNDKPGDMGPTFNYQPTGEGSRTDTVKVIATDSGGLSSEDFIEFQIPNLPPTAAWGNITITEKPPRVIQAEAIPEGNGRYRITVVAEIQRGVTAVARPVANDIDDDFTTYVSLNGTDQWDFNLNQAELPNGTPAFELPDGFEGTAYTWAIDAEGDESSPPAPYEISIPFKSDRLVYTFDVNSDGAIEADQISENNYSFTYSGPDADTIPATVTVTDDTGLSTTVPVDVNVVNRAPVFEQLATLDDEWLVTFVTSAVDPDEDTVRYTFDAGDGSASQTNGGGIFIHRYPRDVYATYSATVSAWDGRGGETNHEFTVIFEPEENLPPIIDTITPIVRPGGQTSVAIEARDPEGEPLSITIDWGDGQSDRVFGGSISRTIPYSENVYNLTVTASDPSGQTTTGFSQLTLVDQPTTISRVQQNRLADGARFFTVQATDPDSPSLRYYWDFNGDGTWESEDNVDNSATYTYPDANEYNVRIGVLDPWSGVMAETIIIVAEELPPVITAVTLSYQPRGRAHILVEAHDPEGGPLTYEIIWGNEEELLTGGEASYSSLPGGEGNRVYAYHEAMPYMGMIRVTDQRGLSTEESFEALIADHATQIQEVSISQTTGGEVLVSVTAEDADSPDDLSYDFDFETDSVWDIEAQLDPLAFHTYPEANTYDITIKVTDPWSGNSSSETITYELGTWNESAIADDHVLGEEGRCVVFRVDPALVTLEAKVDPTACEREEDVTMDWLWDFGDGFTRWGAEAGHRYVDDGIYLVTVSNQDERRPRVSQIQAHITNLAPSFISDPVEVVGPGEEYVYEVRLDDAGITDQLILSLGEAPVGMEVIARTSDRTWDVMWSVSEDQVEGPVRIVLVAEDGHHNAEMTNEGTWVPDGGRTEQSYWLTVRLGGANGLDNPGSGTSSDTNSSESMNQGDAVNLEGEYMPSEDRDFAGGGYATASCDQSKNNSSSLVLLLLLSLMFVGRLRMTLQAKQ
ncbi:MAG: hypothetical protein CMH49_07115 [Myxococcales bacterium]|nr:hypothetical protein [Myxococcales bacterium]